MGRHYSPTGHAAGHIIEKLDDESLDEVAERLAAGGYDAIAVASGSQLLLTVERQVLAVTITHRSRYKYSAQQIKRVWRLHEGILEAIESGDGDRAEALMASHIAESTDIAVKQFGAAGTGAN